MDSFIKAIADGDFSAILSLITTVLSGSFGTALVVLAKKFLKYKGSVTDLVNKVKDEMIPETKKIVDNATKEIVEPLKADLKTIAESIALSVNNDSNSKLAIIENISKIGISSTIKKEVVNKIQEEITTKEEKQEELKNAVKELENNSIENLETL